MKTNKWFRMAAIVGVAAMLSTGCSLLKSKESGNAIDPPPSGTEAVEQAANGTTAEDAQNNLQLTLYLKDTNGFVAPVSVRVPSSISVAKKTLEYMVEDGPEAGMLPEGFQALLPKGTTVKGLSISSEKKLATVDFSKEFLNYDPQNERKILEAVTWALTGLPTVDKVSIWVDGRPLSEMPQGHTPVDAEMTRAMGINLEFAAGTNVGQSVPVTVFFMNSTGDNYSYYVPVTRMVPRTDDLATAALQELIKGPDANKGLVSVMSPETGILQVVRSDDQSTITVNFNDKLLGSDEKIPASAAQAVILSLTQTMGASKVQLLVDGNGKVMGTDNQTYSKPVSAPVHINPLTM